MSLMMYAEYFAIVLLVSSFFAMGGVGSAVALVPLFDFLGLGFLLGKTIALFINTATTMTATYMNAKRGALDVRFAMPLVLTSVVTAPLGAYSSKYIHVTYTKYAFVVFLFFSATMMLVKKKEAVRYQQRWILYMVGAVVGFVSGLLGVGGGALVMPIMIMLGYDAKKMAVAVSFMIPFSTFSAFLSYSSFVTIDYVLLGITAGAAVIGGLIGNRIMHYKLDAGQIKKIIALLLYLIGFKMLYALL